MIRFLLRNLFSRPQSILVDHCHVIVVIILRSSSLHFQDVVLIHRVSVEAIGKKMSVFQFAQELPQDLCFVN